MASPPLHTPLAKEHPRKATPSASSFRFVIGPPQKRAQQHHKNRGRVQQDRRHRQRAPLLAREIQQGKQQHADNPRSEEIGQVPQADAKHAAVSKEENHGEKHQTAQIAQHHNVPGRKARRVQRPVKQANGAPDRAGQ